MDDPWKTAFGKEYPSGFKFEEADTWDKNEWNRLCKTDVVVARRLSLLVELSRRNLLVLGASFRHNSPFAEELKNLSITALYTELSNPKESILRLNEIFRQK